MVAEVLGNGLLHRICVIFLLDFHPENFHYKEQIVDFSP
jgi:hypothetical protein